MLGCKPRTRRLRPAEPLGPNPEREAETMSEKVAQNPEPAIGQVWLLDDPSFRWAGELTIKRIDADEVRFAGGCCSALWALRGGNPDWRCVGIVTPHGRVMVGERRQNVSWGGTSKIVRVENHGWVELTIGMSSGFSRLAADVARWPLVSPHAHAEPHPRKIDGLVFGTGSQTWDTVTIGGVSYPAKEIRIEAKPLETRHAPVLKSPSWDWPDIIEPNGKAGDLFRKTVEECDRQIAKTLLGRSAHRLDPREQGPGISRLPPPEVRPDVVVTAAWEDRWTTP